MKHKCINSHQSSKRASTWSLFSTVFFLYNWWLFNWMNTGVSFTCLQKFHEQDHFVVPEYFSAQSNFSCCVFNWMNTGVTFTHRYYINRIRLLFLSFQENLLFFWLSSILPPHSSSPYHAPWTIRGNVYVPRSDSVVFFFLLLPITPKKLSSREHSVISIVLQVG